MRGVAINRASSVIDVEQALALTTRVFGEQGAVPDYGTHKARLWEKDPYFRPDSLVLARTTLGRVVGVIRLVPRTIYRCSQPFRVAGITSVCVDPEFRGQGISTLLMEYALESCRSEGFELAMLFARRAADHYYTRFGFWGISAYSRVTIRPGSRGPRTGQSFSFKPVARKHTTLFARTYAECYANCFGRVDRSLEYWRFLTDRIALSPGLSWVSVSCGGKPVGYAFVSGSSVNEIACHADVDPSEAFAAVGRWMGERGSRGALVLDMPPQHTMLSRIQGVDITVERRECSYGGHMVRVLDVAAIMAKLEERVVKVDAYPSSARTVMDCDGLRMTADAQRNCNESGGDVWPSFRQTCWLLGAESVSAQCASAERPLPFNMSLPDHF